MPPLEPSIPITHTGIRASLATTPPATPSCIVSSCGIGPRTCRLRCRTMVSPRWGCCCAAACVGICRACMRACRDRASRVRLITCRTARRKRWMGRWWARLRSSSKRLAMVTATAARTWRAALGEREGQKREQRQGLRMVQFFSRKTGILMLDIVGRQGVGALCDCGEGRGGCVGE